MTPKDTLLYMGYQCRVEYAEYENHRIAIRLWDLEDDSPIATVSYNMPEVMLHDDQIIIKNSNEHEGTFQVLVDAGIIKPQPYQDIWAGYKRARIGTLTEGAINEIQRQKAAAARQGQ